MDDKPVPCRRAFTDTILEEAKRDKSIFVITTDARGSVTLGDFAETLPGQFAEAGIAEQNAVGMAAGMALTGNKAFVCGPACFYSARSLEQIKVDVAYTHANVKIIGVSGGVSYGALGASHHSLHDIAVMRTFPGMQVYLPADRFQTVWLTRFLVESPEPAYVRMGRNAVPDVYTRNDIFIAGKANLLKQGRDVAIIACGETVFHALEAAKTLKKEGIQASVTDMHTLKPLDEKAILAAARETGRIVTVEEHSIFGGLGSAVAETVSRHYPVKMKLLGIPDENVINAKPPEIFGHYGLTADRISAASREILRARSDTD